MDNLQLTQYIAQAEQMPIPSNMGMLLCTVTDFTRLKEHDVNDDIIKFCQQALASPLAAVCVFSQYAKLVREQLRDSDIRMACVLNFPTGDESIPAIEQHLQQALDAGVDEFDFVFPYQLYQAGQGQVAIDTLLLIRKLCKNKTLKVIVESGAFKDCDVLKKMCRDIIDAGADFLKTSTGRIDAGASLPAASILLKEIFEARERGLDVGFKASGGIRSVELAAQYYFLAQLIMGEEWVDAQHFRIGASQVLV